MVLHRYTLMRNTSSTTPYSTKKRSAQTRRGHLFLPHMVLNYDQPYLKRLQLFFDLHLLTRYYALLGQQVEPLSFSNFSQRHWPQIQITNHN